MRNIIDIRDLTKIFGGPLRKKIHALEGVEFSICKGEIFGLLGPNGAGKTTLVKILLGLTLPTRGEARLFGVDVGDFRSRAQTGYLPENHSFPPYLTGRQVLEIFGKLSGVRGPERAGRAEKLLKMVKMEQWAGMKLKNYSKGMTQRLGLAQALINDPELVFLDEPTDGVDPLGRQEIRSILLELRNAGKTIFINSHLLSEIEMVCDRVGILNKGRLVAQGRLDELTAEGNRFRIRCRGIGPALQESIQALTLAKNVEDGRLEVTVESLETLNRVIDLIRKEGLLIEAVEPVKRSLESYFIDLVRDIREERGAE